jgi:peptidoglycan/LPS O-acetylase OafA/YrhL
VPLPEPNSLDRGQLRSLTGLRFIAAFHVLIFHCGSWESWHVPPFVRAIAGSGYVAVSLFFVLSGFILTYAHAGRGTRPLQRTSFYASRFARVYPAYAFALVLVAPFFTVHTIRTRGVIEFSREAIAVVTLTQAWVPPIAMAWNPPGWSLSAEAFFYILFPFVVQRIIACRRSTALVLGVGCYLLCLAVPLAYLWLAPDGPIELAPKSTSFWLSVVRYNPAVRFPEFVIGIVFAKGYLELRASRIYRERAALCSLLSVAAIAVILALSPAIPYPIFHNGLLAPLFALLIVSLAAGRGPLAALLATRPLVALGDASYSLYVLQVPLLIFWSKAVVLFPSERFQASRLSTVVFLLLTVVASVLCQRYVESPLRDFALAVFRKRVPRAAPAQPL